MAHVSGFTASDSVTISSGASLAAAGLDIQDRAIVGIDMPAAWTTANLTFQTSDDNSTFQDLYDETGSEYTVTAAPARNIVLVNSLPMGHRYVKVRSGTSASAVVQTADRVLKVLTTNL
jgi:hypothetical protein